jgi:hypothetical protein
MSDNIDELRSENRDMKSKVRAAEGALKDARRGRVKLIVASAIGGFLLFAVGGQWFPGYQLDSTAEATAHEKAAGAVSNVMAELCMERFMNTSELKSRMTALDGETSDWNRANYIQTGTWATLPDGGKADHDTADKCRALIAERVAGQPEKTS